MPDLDPTGATSSLGEAIANSLTSHFGGPAWSRGVQSFALNAETGALDLTLSGGAVLSVTLPEIPEIPEPGLSIEQVQDAVAEMFANGTQTRVAVEYDDAAGGLSLTVPDMSGGGDASANVSDAAYDAGAWNGVTGTAPSQNAMRDQIEAMLTAIAGKATQADIDAATAALVDSSPGALDTLNELAAALGDDANFAATVNTALAARIKNDPTQAGGGDGGVTNIVPITRADHSALVAAGTADPATLYFFKD